MDTYNFIG